MRADPVPWLRCRSNNPETPPALISHLPWHCTRSAGGAGLVGAFKLITGALPEETQAAVKPLITQLEDAWPLVESRGLLITSPA